MGNNQTSTDYLVLLWVLCLVFINNLGAVGSEMVSTSLDNISGFNWDNSTVGVSNKSGIGIWVSNNTDWEDSTSGSSMSNLGSIDFRGISRDNSSIGISNLASIWISSKGIWVDCMTEVSSSGGLNLQGVSRHNSTVGVGYKNLGRADSKSSGENLSKNNLV